jgi:hypothetical protein
LRVISKILYILLCLSIIIANSRCTSDEPENEPEETPDTTAENLTDTTPVLCLPYINESDITYIQPFGVLIDFGDNDMRPHAAVDFGCNDGVEFKASESGTLGSIWLEYSHSYQFNIIINDKYIVHYCIEPVNISSLTDKEKLAAIYFSPGDSVKKEQIVCKMVGGPGHLDWGLIKDNERVCPACYLPDEEYASVNALFKSLPGSYEGYGNLCPDNSYHTNPRQ